MENFTMGTFSPFAESLFSSHFFLALLISLAVIPLFRRVGVKIGLVDHPGGRKKHKVAVPLIGGPAIFTASAVSIVIWGLPEGYEGFAFAAAGLFLLGFIDDRYDISAKFRLVVQAGLVSLALYWDNVWLSDIAFTNQFTLYLDVLGYPITVLLIMGLINAINMLDGLDGLSSGVSLIILGFITGVASTAGATNIALMSSCLFGSLAGFWAFNYRFSWREKASVFMGDSGTTVLGFALPYLAIKLSIYTPAFAPKSVILWLFAIPIWDIVAVIIKRMRDGKSPMEAGRDHIHHVLMSAGLTVRQTLHIIYLLTITTVSFGVAIQYFSFSQIEAYASFFIFMTVYLSRVGSLTRKGKADIYDFRIHGDRRDSKEFEDHDGLIENARPSVVDITTRAKTKTLT